ncbi:phosphotransferase [Yoonia sp. 2307UL14-13]|uniref:phosphotransferase n=1 Tax=Yoonia sp. 2307UL14-13 TaxID=3126506 RepID=UPI00309CC909
MSDDKHPHSGMKGRIMPSDTSNHNADQLDLKSMTPWLSSHIAGFEGPVTVSKFAGGQSNPTFKLSTPNGDYVLRRKPMGPVLPSAHAVDREYRVIAALAKTDVPVPQVYALCTDESVIGSIFYVMEMVEGRVFWDPRLNDQSKADRTAIYDSMNQTIAAIHSVDPDSVGLSDFGRSENYLQRQVGLWTKQYQASITVENEAMDNIIRWLPNNVPDDELTSIVHGDYRLDNVLMHPARPHAVAVLDWELSTIGNPLADLAYHMMAWRFAPTMFRGLAGVDLAALGIPDEQTYLAAYFDRTGLTMPDDWDFYIILSMFRIAAILQGVAKRAEAGNAADAQAKQIGAMAGPIAQQAWALVQSR